MSHASSIQLMKEMVKGLEQGFILLGEMSSKLVTTITLFFHY